MDAPSLSAVRIGDVDLDGSPLPIWSLPLHPFLPEVSGLMLVPWQALMPPLVGPP